MTALPEETRTWLPVCRISELLQERGAAALLPDATQVALFRTCDGVVHALSNTDPVSRANVLSRGIVGDQDGTAVVISPMHKHRFDLRTGRCLGTPEISVPVYEARVIGEWVKVRLP